VQHNLRRKESGKIPNPIKLLDSNGKMMKKPLAKKVLPEKKKNSSCEKKSRKKAQSWGKN
jgi:hypothetical protein